MSLSLTHGQTYEMILRVESLPLTMTDEHLSNILTDVGFQNVALWRVGSPMPPLLASASREMVAVFPEWLTYARGTWDAPTREQAEDLGEATIFRLRPVASSAPAPSGVPWRFVALGGALVLATGIGLAVRDARRRRRLAA